MSNPRFPTLPWDKVVDRVSPSVFQVYAGNSAGTGFVVSLGQGGNSNRHYTMVITAWHVLENLTGSNGELRLVSVDGSKEFSDMSDIIGYKRLGKAVFDTALIYLETNEPLIEIGDMLPVFPADSILGRGAEVGWLGFPGIAECRIVLF